MDEGQARGEATGLYYQAEADGKKMKVSRGFEYRAIAIGNRIIICYTQEESPEKVYFRVIEHGTLGPKASAHQTCFSVRTSVRKSVL